MEKKQVLTKKINVELDKHTANIIYDILTYQKQQLVIAMKKDVFKDNNYLIKAIDEVNNQIAKQCMGENK